MRTALPSAAPMLLCAAVALVPAGQARAQDDDAPATAAIDPEDLPRREVPDYDGRGEDPTTAGEALLWVPRVLLSPAYLLSEFVLRRPLGWVVSDAERGGDAKVLVDLLTGRAQDWGIVPTAYFEFGFRVNLGLYFFLEGFPVDGNHFRVHAATGGVDFWKVTVVDRFPLSGDGTELSFRFHASDRRDHIFAGLGPHTTDAQVGRYDGGLVEGSATLDIGTWNASRLIARVGVRDWSFDEGLCCDDPSIHALVAQGTLDSLPPGFEEEYTAYFQRLELALDTREQIHDDGIRIQVHGEQAFDLQNASAERWVHWGGTAGVYLPVAGERRVASIAAGAYFVDPLGEGAVPFTEQRLLGGGGLLQGFREGRLHGRSALVAALQYQWPIWMWLNGYAQVGAGNVFGAHLDGLDPAALRGSLALGLRTAGEPDHAFEALFAVGTETVDQGLGVDTVRVVVGTTSGF